MLKKMYQAVNDIYAAVKKWTCCQMLNWSIREKNTITINNVSSEHLLDFRITFFQFLLVELKKLELEEKPKLEEDHSR